MALGHWALRSSASCNTQHRHLVLYVTRSGVDLSALCRRFVLWHLQRIWIRWHDLVLRLGAGRIGGLPGAGVILAVILADRAYRGRGVGDLRCAHLGYAHGATPRPLHSVLLCYFPHRTLALSPP